MADDDAPSGPQGGRRLPRRRATSDLRRDLDEQELQSPGAQKLLLEDLDQAEAEVDDLRREVLQLRQDCDEWKTKYFAEHERAAVLSTRAEVNRALGAAAAGGLGTGGVLLGFVPSVSEPVPMIALAVVGAVLMFGGFILERRR